MEREKVLLNNSSFESNPSNYYTFSMEFFLRQEKVKAYIQNVKGFYLPTLAEHVQRNLTKGSRLLELGMGPGLDYFRLKENYKITGSDYSPYFVQEVNRMDPQGEILELDIRDIHLDRRFDGLYSNKVLPHFALEDLIPIFLSLGKLLLPGGIMVHSFWRGDGLEIFEGLPFYYYLPDDLEAFVNGNLELVYTETYGEIDSDDSFVAVFKSRG